MKKKLNRSQTEAKINVLAWQDKTFKKKLITDPHTALKEMGMKKVPKKVSIQIVEEDEDQWIIRLYNRPLNFKKLSEDALEKIALGEPQEAKCCPKSCS